MFQFFSRLKPTETLASTINKIYQDYKQELPLEYPHYHACNIKELPPNQLAVILTIPIITNINHVGIVFIQVKRFVVSYYLTQSKPSAAPRKLKNKYSTKFADIH